MKLTKIFSFILAAALLMGSSCTLLEPENDNHSTFDRVYKEPAFAEGLLIRAYTFVPTNEYRFDEVATDDAVTNMKVPDASSATFKYYDFKKMGTGEWSALFNPQNLWDNCNRGILYVNQFLSIVNNINWKWTNPEQDALFKRRLTGEAYALRGFLKYYLLRNHAGFGNNGELLGTPIYNKFLQNAEDFANPRASFTEAVNSAYADFAEALKYLPMDYGNLAALANLQPGFSEVTDINNYNTVFGNFTQQRISGRITRALNARLALLAASQAFNTNNDITLWQNAANTNGELLKDINGVAGLDATGHLFYLKAQVDNAFLTTGDLKDLPEIVWRRPIASNRTREVDLFPPSLYGNGRINPTQNLVDAFPMANGYPITDAKSLYNPANPYAGRDPRLGQNIVFNGSLMKNTTIKTAVGTTDDGLDAVQNSTRTGYYLKKLLREDVNANPSSPSDQQHYNTHIRHTELFLNYAEAANEAWGPSSGGTFAFSAKDVIGAIRKRAGITQPDNYLLSITDKAQMRELIRNERRIELCFEGFRFWDLRRWKEDLTIPAKGVRIDGSNYTYFTVEERSYNNSFMHYGPIPDKEILKFSLIQNKGWN